MWRKVGAITPQSLQRREDRTRLEASQIIDQVERLVPRTATVRSFRDGKLTIECDNSAELFLLHQDREELLDRINRHLSQPLVRAIVFRVKR